MYYDKRIRYIDYVENGEKQRNCGYIKITVTGGRLLLEMQIKGLYATDDVASEVMLEGTGTERRIGTVSIRQGNGSFRWEIQDQTHQGEEILLSEGLSYGQLLGIVVHLSSRRSLHCMWRERVPVVSAVKEQAVESVAREQELILEEVVQTGWQGMPETGAAQGTSDEKREAGMYIYPEREGKAWREEAVVQKGAAKQEKTIGKEGTVRQGEAVEQEGVARQEGAVEQEGVARQKEGTARQEGAVEQEGAARREETIGKEGTARQGEVVEREGVTRQEEAIGQERSATREETIEQEGSATREWTIGQERAATREETVGRERAAIREETIGQKETAVQEIAVKTEATSEIEMSERSEGGAAPERLASQGKQTGQDQEALPEREEPFIGKMPLGRQQPKPEELHTAETRRAVSQEPPAMPMSEEKWQQLQRIYPHIRPFQDEREYLSLRPQDFVILRSDSYRLVQNSFLLHGFYNYQHLMLTYVSQRNAGQYYIGVPGNFYEKEKQVAIMYGFSSFECEHEPANEGDFGYYMIRVEL